jgi:hypothetical protein
MALAAAPRLVPLRPAMVKLGDAINLKLVDNLTQLACAFWYTTGDFIRLQPEVDSLQSLHEEGSCAT